MNAHGFDAMGCEIAVGGASPRARRAIEALFHERELIFSRFIADSELNRVNAGAGRFVLVSPLFAETLRIALRAAEETHGLVEPTLGAALVASGIMRVFLGFNMKGGTPWGWVVASGLITLLLGIIILIHWPVSSLYVLGIFLGIDLVFAGASWIGLGLGLRQAA